MGVSKRYRDELRHARVFGWLWLLLCFGGRCLNWVKLCLCVLLVGTARAQIANVRQLRDLSTRWAEYYAAVYRVPLELISSACAKSNISASPILTCLIQVPVPNEHAAAWANLHDRKSPLNLCFSQARYATPPCFQQCGTEHDKSFESTPIRLERICASMVASCA
jgi:hypothetical protein